MKRIFARSVSCLLITCACSSSLIAQNVLSAPVNVPSDNSVLENEHGDEPTEWTEIVTERTLYSSSFRSQDGQIKQVFSSNPIHYTDASGRLQPIITDLESDGSGNWKATRQPHPVYLYSNGSFALSSVNGDPLKLGAEVHVNGQPFTAAGTLTGNRMIQRSSADHLSRIIDILENGVELSYLLEAPLNGSPSGIIFEEKVDLPKGYKIEGRYLTDAGNFRYIEILDSDGNRAAWYDAIVCYDDAKNWITGEYQIIERESGYFIQLLIPEQWISAGERQFPVVIDPLIQGPTSTWNGGNMPSCLLPNVNKDSIQVVIPAGVTVTGLFVTGSFYADPWTTATMGQGEMRYSTTCGTSQAYTVTGANATLPGTAYLDSVNILNPLMCCFPESCVTTSFYLRMHLGRTGPGTGCNTTYIRYDALTTQWPFQAVVFGRTAEASGSKWSVPNTPICASTCTITGTAYVYYGVAPYTYTHPWSTQVVTQGQNVGCSNGSDHFQFTLNIPNCPNYCDTATSLNAPPPVVTDACGHIVSGMPTETVTIKPTPHVTANGSTTICSGETLNIQLEPCLPGATANWAGNGSGGSSTIGQTLYNGSDTSQHVDYISYSSLNGCNSDTTVVSVTVNPNPQASFTWVPDPAIVSENITFTDNSGSSAAAWEWSFNDSVASTISSADIIENTPGNHMMCLAIQSTMGCWDTLCLEVPVEPATITVPNVISPNGDGTNDVFFIKYLDFYPDNELIILNRWGNTVYSKKGYKNDWDGDDLTDGVYFYKLTISGQEGEYSGFFHIVR